MDNLKRLIKAKGWTLEGFAREVLGIDYQSFYKKWKKGKFNYLQILKIMYALGCSFEELGKPFTRVTSKTVGNNPGNEGGAQPSEVEQKYNEAHNKGE